MKLGESASDSSLGLPHKTPCSYNQRFYPVKTIFLIKNKCVREVVVKSFVDPLLQFEPIIGPTTLHQPPSLPVLASFWGETRAVRYSDSIHSRFENASISHWPASLLFAKTWRHFSICFYFFLSCKTNYSTRWTKT